MGILLVHPGSDTGFKNFESVPPLGLVSLYSSLPEEYKRETKLLDGSLIGTKYIADWMEVNRPDIVGISSLTFGYKTAIEIGRAAQRSGAITVLGGRHATDVLPNVLREMREGRRPFNYVVSGEGENIFRKLVHDFYSGGEIQPQQNLFSNRTTRNENKNKSAL